MTWNPQNGTAPAEPTTPARDVVDVAARSWTEAPFSVTVRAPMGGRDVMLTLRGESGAEVLPKLDALIKYLNETTARDHDGSPLCPVHGARLKESKFDPKSLFCPAKTGDGAGRCQYTTPAS